VVVYTNVWIGFDIFSAARLPRKQMMEAFVLQILAECHFLVERWADIQLDTMFWRVLQFLVPW